LRFLPVGSVLWLLLHELRLTFRGAARANRIGLIIAAAFVVVVTVGAGLPLALLLRHRTVSLTPYVVSGVDAAAILLFTLFLSQTLSSATQVLYERGDLDLLLSSPIPPQRVLAVRAAAIAAQPFAVFGSLLTPFLVPFALFGHARWLAAYGVLGALALSASAIGIMAALGLFVLIGPRRTRAAGQILAAVVGAAFFLFAQLRNLLPHQAPTFYEYLKSVAQAGYFRPDTLAAWPARAALGEPLAFFVLFAISLLLFGVSARALGARFSRDASIAAGVEGVASRPRTRADSQRFRRGVVATLIRKELRLLRRDPALLSQVLLRVLYLVPLMLIVVRSAVFRVAGQLETGSGVFVFAAAQVAASLAWITISAEDAPDLLACAPVSRGMLRWAKLAAALVPLAALLSLPILVLAWFSPWVGVVAAAGVCGSSLSIGLTSLWFETPVHRKNFRRRSGGSLIGNLAALSLGMVWSATTVGAAAGSPWSVAGLGIALILLAGFYALRSAERI
jgi:ABC-2 type transport system permease protein